MAVNQDQKQFILEGNLTSVMWKLSLPAILAMVLYGMNAFMDTVYIGQLLDETALAGVALAYPLTSITLGLGSWIGTGAGNYLSISLGRDDQDTLQRIIPNTTFLTLAGTLLFAIPAYLFAEPLLHIMGARETILEYGVNYFKVTLLAAPLWVYALSLNFIVRSEGKMLTAALIMASGLILNLALTPILILYFDMHVEGAAWATNAGMLVYCITGYFYFKSGKASFIPNINSIRFDKEIFQSILKLGFPGFILTAMGVVQAIVVFNAIVKVGDDTDLAFFAAANRIVLFLMTPLFGLMRALQPIEGVNFGAGQLERVRASFLLFCKTGFGLVFPFWVFMMFFPEPSIRLMLPNAELTSADILNFRIYAAIIPLLPFVFMALTHLPAVEQPKFASLIGIARQLVFYVPVMLLLPRFIGIQGIYIGATAIDVVVTLWLVYIVYQSFKKLEPSATPQKV